MITILFILGVVILLHSFTQPQTITIKQLHNILSFTDIKGYKQLPKHQLIQLVSIL